jgi:Alpha/beta hydrolase domain
VAGTAHADDYIANLGAGDNGSGAAGRQELDSMLNPPAKARRLQVTTSGSVPSFVLDANGNVKGGVRTPAVDVPVATLSGLGQSGSSFCFLFGTTTPFSAPKLAALYPTHARFVTRWAVSTAANVAAGFIRPADAAELVAAAIRSGVGG